jgi:transcriptional regulator with XRE-family HTH domain
MEGPMKSQRITISKPALSALARAGERLDEFAPLLKNLRVEAGLSQQELADRALVSVQAISALERGYRKTPHRATLERIADALGVPRELRDHAERTHSARRHNLPRPVTSFVGRDDVVAEIEQLLRVAPLVTIVGTRGAGKTRAAIEVGYRVLNQFPHGVWFVELAPLDDAELVLHAMADTLGIEESPYRPLFDTLVTHLLQRRLLVILDGCEPGLSQARKVAGGLLRQCPSVTLLATSREALNVGGERTYEIRSLAVPTQSPPSPEEAMKYGAVALFVDRVRAADYLFELNSENVESVVAICRRLDGVPLAIELAAERAFSGD